MTKDPLYIISFSGGIGSAVSFLLAYEHGLNFIGMFADTLIEDEDLYRFKDDIEAVTGHDIQTWHTNRTPWDAFIEAKFIGNSRTAHCSQYLKTDVIRSVITEIYMSDNPVLVLGMSIEEVERIERAKKHWEPIPVMSLLIKYRMNSRCSQEALLAKYGLKLPRLYEYGFPHNNCGGFCCRGGQSQFATLLKHFPERYAWHEEQEAKAYAAIGKTARPFIQVQRDKVKRYLTLRQFREEIEAGTLTPKEYEWGGCACFIDEVEEDATTNRKNPRPQQGPKADSRPRPPAPKKRPVPKKKQNPPAR